MAIQERFQPGDRVTVPWGLYEVVGTVLQIYGPPGHHSVIVRVPVRGPSGEELGSDEISFPEDALHRAVAV